MRVLGFMSGTSLDGVDAAILETDGERILAFGSTAMLPFTDSERAMMVAGADQRHPGPFSSRSSVDVNAILASLIKQVDVTTGGAAAVYGADAVTGVVHFILNEDFKGLQVSATGRLGSMAARNMAARSWSTVRSAAAAISSSPPPLMPDRPAWRGRSGCPPLGPRCLSPIRSVSAR